MMPEIKNKDLYEHTHCIEDKEQEEEHVELYIIPNLVPQDIPCNDYMAELKGQPDTEETHTDSEPDMPSTSSDANSKENPGKHEKTPFWLIILAILYVIGEVVLFIPLALLALFGISKHPFMGYIIIRDIMRKK